MFPSAEDVRRKARLAVILRAGRGRPNPAPGRQVHPDAVDFWGLPAGTTITPGMRRLTGAQREQFQALTPEQRSRYFDARRTGTHAAAIKAVKPDDPLKREMARVTRVFQPYTSEQRASHQASHRLTPGQKNATGEYFYTHPDVPNIAFKTRGEAARRGLAAQEHKTPDAPAPAKAAPTKRATKAARPPARPVDIHKLFEADDATIEAALRDVYEGQFGPFKTKVTHVGIVRAGTRTDSRGREREVKPDIGVDGKIYTTYRDWRGEERDMEIGHFSRSIGPVVSHYADGRIRREIWAYHGVVELGGGEDENGREDTRYHGKGFGGEFLRRSIDWYRASGAHGVGLSDHNGYVWASMGFNFNGGQVPEYLIENIRTLLADLKAGKKTSAGAKDDYRTIPKRLRDAPDLDSQIAAAEAVLARIESHKPGDPEYPTAYEISQIGRRPGQRGKTALWLGKLLYVSTGQLVLNPDEGEDVVRALLRVKPAPIVVKRQNALFDLYNDVVIAHADEPDYDPDDDPTFVAKAHQIIGITREGSPS